MDPGALRGIIDQPRTTAWSRVTIARDEPHDGVWLRLTVTDPRVCRINAPRRHPGRGVRPGTGIPLPGPGQRRLTRLPHLRRRENGDQVRWELGAIGHGPAADELTEHLCTEVRAWSTERDQRKPKLIAYPANTPDSDLHGTIIDKSDSRLVLTYDDNAQH